jgi:site-specific DNA recombinase
MNERTVTVIPSKEAEKPSEKYLLRVAAYCRVSDPTAEQASSLETQTQYYAEKIANNPHWKSAGIFAEICSGRNIKKRDELKKLLAKCRAGKVDLILTKSISRLGRNSLETIRALRQLQGLGVDVFFEKENIRLSDATAQRVMEIYCALAQDESENKSKNIKWGIKAGFQSGTSGYQHFTCYGYRYDTDKQMLVIEPAEADVVRMIFQLRTQGKSCGVIAKTLMEMKTLSPTGKSFWNRECIRKMLHNEKYTGSVLLQKTYVEDFFTGKQSKNLGQQERYYYKNNHPAIISMELFESVQE